MSRRLPYATPAGSEHRALAAQYRPSLGLWTAYCSCGHGANARTSGLARGRLKPHLLAEARRALDATVSATPKLFSEHC